jgi:hypothetical protein
MPSCHSRRQPSIWKCKRTIALVSRRHHARIKSRLAGSARVPAVSAYLCLQHLSTTHVHCFWQGWNFGKVILDNSGTKFWNDNPNQGWGAEGWYPATFALPVQVRLSLLNLCWIATNLAFQAEIKARLTCDLACRSLYCGVAKFFACSPPTQEVFFCLNPFIIIQSPACMFRAPSAVCMLQSARARALSLALSLALSSVSDSDVLQYG